MDDVGTDGSAHSTADTGFGVDRFHRPVAFGVEPVLGQPEDVMRANTNAEAASLTAIFVNDYETFGHSCLL
jgi:hypothetical protein